MILAALNALSKELGRRGISGEVCLFGGTVMVIAFSARISTRDVDAIFQPAQAVRESAEVVAQEQGLPAHWLNDAVKDFVSARHEVTVGSLPQFAHLSVTMPVPEYLLAMKCMASRLGGTVGEHSDLPDIRFLIKHLGLKAPQDVLDLVAKYYPENRIPVRTQYVIEGLFEEGKT
jgi:hypothetical protein